MDLVPCEKCQQQVSATAETCPHCGHIQPETIFRCGIQSLACPNCRTRNYLSAPRCRCCGAELAEALWKAYPRVDHQRFRSNVKLWAFAAAFVAGALAGLVVFLAGVGDPPDWETRVVISICLGSVGGVACYLLAYLLAIVYQLFRPPLVPFESKPAEPINPPGDTGPSSGPTAP